MESAPFKAAQVEPATGETIAETRTRLRDLQQRPEFGPYEGALASLDAALSSSQGQASSQAHAWAKVDLFRMFDGEVIEIEGSVETLEQASKLEVARNFIILLPLLFTWFSLAAATSAYAELIKDQTASSDAPFIALWERGFDGFRGNVIGGWDGSFLGIFPTLSNTAIIDVVLIIAAVSTTLWAGYLRRKVEVSYEQEHRNAVADLHQAMTWATVHLARVALAGPTRFAEIMSQSGEQLESTFRSLSAIDTSARQRLQSVEASATQIREALGSLTNQASRTEVSTQNLGGNVGDLRTSLDEAMSSISEVSLQIQLLSNQQTTMGETLKHSTDAAAATVGELMGQTEAQALEIGRAVSSFDGFLRDSTTHLVNQSSKIVTDTGAAVEIATESLGSAAGHATQLGNNLAPAVQQLTQLGEHLKVHSQATGRLGQDLNEALVESRNQSESTQSTLTGLVAEIQSLSGAISDEKAHSEAAGRLGQSLNEALVESRNQSESTQAALAALVTEIRSLSAAISTERAQGLLGDDLRRRAPKDSDHDSPGERS
jgi:predicted  nucleic acid-binding Zn-ribbon protein